MAEPIVDFVVETIGKMLIEEALFLHGVSDQVEQLQSDLSRLRSFLKDADAKRNDDEMVKVWVSQSRDLAYEADDLIEGYAFRIASRKGNMLKRCACIFSECAVRHSLGAEIQTLRSKISDLTKSFQNYGLTSSRERESGSSSSSLEQLRRTYSHVAEDDFMGLEGDVETLVAHLVNESGTPHYRVVSICGMGGLGKTTIARKVYNHPKVKRYFDGFAWVCISQQWEKREILEGILIKFIPSQREEIKKWRDEELIRKLHRMLQENRYLIVLDDIWSIDAWNCIKEAFPIREDGSKILVTTRIKEVAMQIGPTGYHHEPRLLNELESWELLRLKTSRQMHHQGPENKHKMEELGKEMVKQCGGLPLAVVVLGGILATKNNVNEWETVQKNVKAYLGKGKNIADDQGEVHKILELSYNDLPHKLKHCFLYLSRYPEDSDIRVETLYQLWIAEGMISVKDRIGEESMMDVAQCHLEELVERSIVQVEVDENRSRVARFSSCRLHDLVRDLSLQKAKEENFFLFVHSRNGFDDDQVYSTSSSTGQIHRLVIDFDEVDIALYVPPPKRVTKHLRSLSFLRHYGYGVRRPWTIKSQLSWFRMLRVLEIDGLDPWLPGFKERLCYALDQLKLPEVVGNLIHLRYLSLRSSAFWWIPLSISNLKRLQTFNLRNFGTLWIPNVLYKMRELRHLYLPDFSSQNELGRCLVDKLRLDGLNKLEILEGFNNMYCSTKDLHKLINLRQLQAEVFLRYEDIIEIVTFLSNSNSLHYAMLDVEYPGDDPLTTEN